MNVTKEEKKKFNMKEKGITLIALVITIIILLILAGVTLNMTLSQNGLFSKAKEAADKYEQAQEDEELEIEKVAYELNGKNITKVEKISDNDGFKNFRDKVNSGENFENTLIKLYSDLDLSGETWEPIGTAEYSFNGVFDGNGHKIKNLVLGTIGEEYKGDDAYYLGLFGFNKGTIKNIVIEGNDIELSKTEGVKDFGRAGIIAGYSEGIIENCYNKANIIVKNVECVGAIAGRIEHGGQIYKCYNGGKITNDASVHPYIGGICGWTTESTIKSCCNAGIINVKTNLANAQVGGISAFSKGTIDSCYNKADITLTDISNNNLSYQAVAGIVGQSNSVTITNCYNIGNIVLEGSTNRQRWASILGSTWSPDSATIKNCYMKDNIDRTYCWPDGGGKTAEGVEEAIEITDDIKADLHEKLGECFVKDEKNDNNGYPILEWQK